MNIVKFNECNVFHVPQFDLNLHCRHCSKRDNMESNFNLSYVDISSGEEENSLSQILSQDVQQHVDILNQAMYVCGIVITVLKLKNKVVISWSSNQTNCLIFQISQMGM